MDTSRVLRKVGGPPIMMFKEFTFYIFLKRGFLQNQYLMEINILDNYNNCIKLKKTQQNIKRKY